MSVACVALPGTCGELVQGTIDGMPFLVSCPIDRYSVVDVLLSDREGWRAPRNTPKALAAVHAALRHVERQSQGGRLRVRSRLPRSKGYASSTADVAGAIYAAGEALGVRLDARTVARLALGVEPSDSTMFPGLALMDHRTGRCFEPLGAAPPLCLVILDEGGSVDTHAFNAVDRRQELGALVVQHREALAVLRHGLRDRDWSAVGHAATLSAQAHQRILPKALLPVALRLAREVGALGVCVAHSGTLLGLLLSPETHEVRSIFWFLRRRLLERGVRVEARRMVGGGPRSAGRGLPISTLCKETS